MARSSSLRPSMNPRSSDLGMLLNTARALIDGEVTTFDEAVEMREPVFGTFSANTGRGNEAGEPVGAGMDSGTDTRDAIDANKAPLFEQFQLLPLEIRSKIWVAAAEAARPNGIYHFTFKSVSMRPGPSYPDVCDTVLANLFKVPPSHPLSRSVHDLLLWAFDGCRVQTFTPSATVAKMTRPVRDLFRSCSEARTEIMRCPRLSSAFEFYYLKGGKCNLGTIRPFLYDTDWVSMDGHLDHDDPDVFVTSNLGTRDIKRIEHFALSDDGFWDFYPGTIYSGYHKPLPILRWLDGLKSVGLYGPSFAVKRVRKWDEELTEDDRVFLKVFPAPLSGPLSAAPRSVIDYSKAYYQLWEIVRRMGFMQEKKTAESWPANSCDISALRFCLILHTHDRKGIDLMRFKKHGSHLDSVDFDEPGTMRFKRECSDIDNVESHWPVTMSLNTMERLLNRLRFTERRIETQ